MCLSNEARRTAAGVGTEGEKERSVRVRVIVNCECLSWRQESKLGQRVNRSRLLGSGQERGVYSGSKATSSLRGEPLFSHPCASSVNCLHTDKESKSNEGYGQSPAL